ncbi:hypothetical protein ASE86_14415 [Sphingomonas sp. Leaf33]|uniref:hypothetical protein n=1 Tax=Sphingomonas sp. Leaf33 TaxID=1736215 RepID=UPI0006FA1A06|nr:hypothetical protein [Sphingomonas sp. Leaf33]KQN21416.1 hypothetical protein ASE86_14415 [Sphingomonas sp. Leaf33]
MAAVTAATSIVAMLAAAPARLGGGGAIDVSLGRIVSALLVCLLLAGAAALLLRRGGGRIDWRALADWKKAAPARRIVVIETRRISAHADICLFRCDDRDYLVLCSASQQQVLRDPPAEPAA